MRSLLSLLVLASLSLAGCADTKEPDNFKVRFKLGESGITDMTLAADGLTSTCKSTRDRSAVFLMVANESDVPQVCDFSCAFGDPESEEETYTLECKDVLISANAPRAAYCYRDVGELKQSLGSISNFHADCE